MERVRALAQRLGQAIAEHERTKALKQARETFQNDTEAQQLQKNYDDAATLIQKKEREGKPLEPEDKRREAELREKVVSSKTITALLRAQVDFHDLLGEVNRTIEAEIGLD